MRLDELVRLVEEDYYSASLPEDPGARLAALRELVGQRWEALEPHARLRVAEEAEAAGEPITLGREQAEVTDAEIDAVDQRDIDSLTALLRRRIPELSVSDT